MVFISEEKPYVCLVCGKALAKREVCGCVKEQGERIAGQAPIGSEDCDDDKEFAVLVKGGYEPLIDVLLEALDQAQIGKGHERHADGKPFLEQQIMQIRRDEGSGYTLGQARKKANESKRLPTDKAVVDLLGAINYLAAEVLARREECQR